MGRGARNFSMASGSNGTMVMNERDYMATLDQYRASLRNYGIDGSAYSVEDLSQLMIAGEYAVLHGQIKYRVVIAVQAQIFFHIDVGETGHDFAAVILLPGARSGVDAKQCIGLRHTERHQS